MKSHSSPQPSSPCMSNPMILTPSHCPIHTEPLSSHGYTELSTPSFCICCSLCPKPCSLSSSGLFFGFSNFNIHMIHLGYCQKADLNRPGIPVLPVLPNSQVRPRLPALYSEDGAISSSRQPSRARLSSRAPVHPPAIYCQSPHQPHILRGRILAALATTQPPLLP